MFSGLAGDAAEFSRGQFFRALMLQPQDEEQPRAASIITMATLIFILAAQFFCPSFENKDVYIACKSFFFNLTDKNCSRFSKSNLSNAL